MFGKLFPEKFSEAAAAEPKRAGIGVERAIRAGGSRGVAGRRRSRSWSGLWAAAPAVLLALLPRLLCPCQAPAYGGLLAATGLTLILADPVRLPLTAASLTFALAMLALQARQRRGWGPFGLGLMAAGVILAGSLASGRPAMAMLGGLLLILAALWHAWPPRPAKIRWGPDGY